jgi:hypothetical protein
VQPSSCRSYGDSDGSRHGPSKQAARSNSVQGTSPTGSHAKHAGLLRTTILPEAPALHFGAAPLPAPYSGTGPGVSGRVAASLRRTGSIDSKAVLHQVLHPATSAPSLRPHRADATQVADTSHAPSFKDPAQPAYTANSRADGAHVFFTASQTGARPEMVIVGKPSAPPQASPSSPQAAAAGVPELPMPLASASQRPSEHVPASMPQQTTKPKVAPALQTSVPNAPSEMVQATRPHMQHGNVVTASTQIPMLHAPINPTQLHALSTGQQWPGGTLTPVPVPKPAAMDRPNVASAGGVGVLPEHQHLAAPSSSFSSSHFHPAASEAIMAPDSLRHGSVDVTKFSGATSESMAHTMQPHLQSQEYIRPSQNTQGVNTCVDQSSALETIGELEQHGAQHSNLRWWPAVKPVMPVPRRDCVAPNSVSNSDVLSRNDTSTRSKD